MAKLQVFNLPISFVTVVDATGTEQGYANDPEDTVLSDKIGVYVEKDGVWLLYPWSRVLEVEFRG